MKYGIGYKGSKSRIAEKILDILPDGERFCDLFGGGFAMSHAALLSGKYKSVLYSEIEPTLVQLVRDAVAGKFNADRFNPTWISRDEFQQKKYHDGYVRYIWSFGNNGEDYLYSRDIEEWKSVVHKMLTSETLDERQVWYRKMMTMLQKNADIVEKPKSTLLCVENLARLSRLIALERIDRLRGFERIDATHRIEMRCADYQDYEYIPGDVVYCDIPYQASVSGNTYERDFDYASFYEWAISRPYQVFFSSYEIKDAQFYAKQVCVMTSSYSASNNAKRRIEYLYSNMPFPEMQEQTEILLPQ